MGVLASHAGYAILGLRNAISNLWDCLLELPRADMVRGIVSDVVHLCRCLRLSPVLQSQTREARSKGMEGSDEAGSSHVSGLELGFLGLDNLLLQELS